MTQELDSWKKFAPEQGPLHSQAQEISRIFQTYKPVLLRDEIDGAPHLVTPETEFDWTSGRKHGVGTAYFFKERHDSANTVSIFIDQSPGVKGNTRRLSLDLISGSVTDLDDRSREFTDADLLQSALTATETALSTKMKSRKGRRNSIRTVAAVALTATLAIGGVTEYFTHKSKVKTRQKAEAALATKIATEKFDQSGYKLPKNNQNSFTVSATKLPQIDSETYAKIPHYQDGDNLLTPRWIRVYTNGCTWLPTQAIPGMKYVVAQEAGSAGPEFDPTVSVSTNRDGNIDVCWLDTHDNYEWEVAIQAVKQTD